MITVEQLKQKLDISSLMQVPVSNWRPMLSKECQVYVFGEGYLAKRFERCSLELLLYVKPLSLVFYPINSNHHFTDFSLFLLNLARPLVSVWVSLSKKKKKKKIHKHHV